MTTPAKLRCPECGAEMNHHADRPDYAAALADPAAVDKTFGAVVDEIHTCPACAATATRRATPAL
jgi:predicted RNA-binding Zn-ribbon protein involved in translation (DUF1610 family)